MWQEALDEDLRAQDRRSVHDMHEKRNQQEPTGAGSIGGEK